MGQNMNLLSSRAWPAGGGYSPTGDSWELLSARLPPSFSALEEMDSVLAMALIICPNGSIGG